MSGVYRPLYSRRRDGQEFDGGELIRQKIFDYGTTQKAVDIETGINYSRLSNIIHGHCRPSARDIRAIAAALDINLEDWKKQSEYVREIIRPAGRNFYDESY